MPGLLWTAGTAFHVPLGNAWRAPDSAIGQAQSTTCAVLCHFTELQVHSQGRGRRGSASRRRPDGTSASPRPGMAAAPPPRWARQAAARKGRHRSRAARPSNRMLAVVVKPQLLDKMLCRVPGTACHAAAVRRLCTAAAVAGSGGDGGHGLAAQRHAAPLLSPEQGCERSES